MSTNDALRQRVTKLVSLGVAQKTIAAKMGISESAMTRWLKEETERHLPLSALDGFHAYLIELRAETNREVNIEAAHAAEVMTEARHRIDVHDPAAPRRKRTRKLKR